MNEEELESWTVEELYEQRLKEEQERIDAERF